MIKVDKICVSVAEPASPFALTHSNLMLMENQKLQARTIRNVQRMRQQLAQ